MSSYAKPHSKPVAKPLRTKAFTPVQRTPTSAQRRAIRQRHEAHRRAWLDNLGASVWGQTVTRQSKLEVSQPGDALEREADRVAEHVLRMDAAERTDSRSATGGAMTVGGRAALGGLIQRQAESEKDADAGLADDPGIRGPSSREIAEATPQPSEQQELETGPVLRKVESETGPIKGASLTSLLAPGSSNGSALPSSVRGRLERGLNADLSGVRVHTDGSAEQACRQVGAKAFTHHNHIYFRTGRFAPHTPAGFRLVAHETVHTLQQSRGPGHLIQRKPEDTEVHASLSGTHKVRLYQKPSTKHEFITESGKDTRPLIGLPLTIGEKNKGPTPTAGLHWFSQIHGNIGLHSNKWQPTFGYLCKKHGEKIPSYCKKPAQTRKTDMRDLPVTGGGSSNGCLRLKDADAKQVFNAVEKGTEVHLYEGRWRPPAWEATGSTYVVKPGDTLSGIAKKFGIDEDALAKLNGIEDKSKIRAGATLKIPPK